MNLKEHLGKNNLHHAYLIEGNTEELVKEVTQFLQSIKIKTEANPDFVQIYTDSFKVDDARNLKVHSNQKGYSSSEKVFIISANNFLLEAQNSLLKLFEEPIENTYFFVITPDASGLLKTLISRFYFVSAKESGVIEKKDAEKFIAMSPSARISFIKELLVDEDSEGEINPTNSPRSRSLVFLNALESSLHKKMSKDSLDTKVFEHLFKVREYLRVPGSSPKTLMESVALIIPNFSK
jgi:DNA polymerase III delta prime subunit